MAGQASLGSLGVWGVRRFEGGRHMMITIAPSLPPPPPPNGRQGGT